MARAAIEDGNYMAHAVSHQALARAIDDLEDNVARTTWTTLFRVALLRTTTQCRLSRDDTIIPVGRPRLGIPAAPPRPAPKEMRGSESPEGQPSLSSRNRQGNNKIKRSQTTEQFRRR
jgi:hypothetical protein